MATITFSDGQTVDPTRIMRVSLFTDGEERLLVELKDSDPLRVFGAGVHADAAMLNDVRDKLKLHFLVHEPSKPNP